MARDAFLEIRNWGKYQHYTERRPPWIKLYGHMFDLADNPDMAALGVPARYLAMKLLILASKNGNRIPSSIPWLSIETKMTHGSARNALKELRKIGFIRDADTNGALFDASNGDSAVANLDSAAAMPKETETEGSLLRKLPWAGKSKEPRPRDEIWDTLIEIFGPVENGTSAHGKRNNAVRELKLQHATPASIRAARKRWDRMFEGATATDKAIAVHYPQLLAGTQFEHGKAPIPPCPECEVGGGMHAVDCPLSKEDA